MKQGRKGGSSAVARAGLALFLAYASVVVINPIFGLIFRDMNLSDWVAAVLAGLAAAALLAGSFFWYRILRFALWRDRHMLWAGLGIALGHTGFATGFAFADTLGAFLALVLMAVSRMFSTFCFAGIQVGALAIAGAVSGEAAEHAGRDKASRSYAILNLCGALAIIVGPLAGGFAGAADLLWPLILSIPLATLTAVVAPPLAAPPEASIRRDFVPSRSAAPFILANLAVFLSLASLQLALVFFVADASGSFEGAASAIVGLSLFAGGFAMILANIVLVVSNRSATVSTLAAASVVTGLGFALAAQSFSTGTLVASLALVGLGAGVAITYSASLANAASARSGSSATWLALSQGAGAVIGPTFGLLLYASAGLFEGLALLMLATAFLVVTSPRRKHPSD